MRKNRNLKLAQAGRPLASRGKTAFSVSILIIATVASYGNSLDGPFHFDDLVRIEENESIRTIWPISAPMSATTRPLGMLSFAVNYSIHGLDVRGYHATNLLIHIGSGLTLFGIIRRTLSNSLHTVEFVKNADSLALTISLIWLIHPLNTQAVTYVVQRLESMMGFCYLLTIYLFARSQFKSTRRLGWYVGSIVACAVGMGTKEVMVTAPLMVLWYDRVFVASSWREILQNRWAYYFFLVLTWLVLVWCMLRWTEDFTGGNIGVVDEVTPFRYVISQSAVITHYLRLCFWPFGQSLDYGWPVAKSISEVALPLTLIGGVFLATCWASIRFPSIGFLGGWFFVILAPTSSLVPIIDLAFEHRMYLSSIAVIAVAVFAVFSYLETLRRKRRIGASTKAWLELGLVIALSFCLCLVTWHRNAIYASRVSIWENAAKNAPHNSRAHSNLGGVLQRNGLYDRALKHNQEAVRLAPNSSDAHSNLGASYIHYNELDKAVEHLRKSLDIRHTSEAAHANLGLALWKRGKRKEAKEHFRTALALSPNDPDVLGSIARAYADTGDLAGAIEEYEAAIAIAPQNAELLYNLGVAYQDCQRFTDAKKLYERSIAASPQFAPPYNNLGFLLVAEGRIAEAATYFRRVTEISPNLAVAHANLGNALIDSGDTSGGIRALKRALELDPQNSKLHERLLRFSPGI